MLLFEVLYLISELSEKNWLMAHFNMLTVVMYTKDSSYTLHQSTVAFPLMPQLFSSNVEANTFNYKWSELVKLHF